MAKPKRTFYSLYKGYKIYRRTDVKRRPWSIYLPWRDSYASKASLDDCKTMIDRMVDRGEAPPPNYDYTTRERDKRIRQRKTKSYMIVKALAQRAGFMSGPDDFDGLDRFLDRFAVEGREIDWLEIEPERN